MPTLKFRLEVPITVVSTCDRADGCSITAVVDFDEPQCKVSAHSSRFHPQNLAALPAPLAVPRGLHAHFRRRSEKFSVWTEETLQVKNAIAVSIRE